MSIESVESRSAIMRAVTSANTSPELKVRRMLHEYGYRYRLHVSSLPGKPDIVFPSRRKTVFVNGCFWHGHTCARGARIPKTNAEYWIIKIARNRRRDAVNRRRLKQSGWKTFVVWECELKNQALVLRRLNRFLQ